MDKKKDNNNITIILEDDKENKESPRGYSLWQCTVAAKDTVECISTTNGNIEVKQSSTNTTTLLSCSLQSVSGIRNNTEIEKEKKSQGKKWIVKVQLDSDIKIISKAFITSPTMGVSLEQCENFNEDNIAKTQCVVRLTKKATKKVGKVDNMFLINLVSRFI